MKGKYFQVFEYQEHEDKRLIYTFDNEPSAWGLVEYLSQNDNIRIDVGVEEHEAST